MATLGDDMPTMHEICEFSGARVAECGAGTGRVTRMYVQAATEVTGFFFGPEPARAIRRQNSPVVPGFTGVWSKRVGGGP